MNGLVPATILLWLSKQIKVPLHQKFQLLAGTSIGGIIILLLSRGFTPESIVSFFTVDGPVIFKKRWWRFLAESRYPAGPIKSVLEKRFGDARLANCKTNVLVTSLDVAHKKTNFFNNFSGSHNNYRLSEVAQATAAAQTYFPAVKMSGDCLYWDGGNVSNEPIMCAAANAFHLWGRDAKIRILSLGCGTTDVSPTEAFNRARKLANPNWLVAAGETLNLSFESGSEDAQYQAEQIFGEKFLHIEPVFKSIPPLDSATENSNSLRIDAANEMIVQRGEEILAHIGA